MLAVVLTLFARQNLSVPGLYYDEAIFGGLTRDFLTGEVQGRHLEDARVTDVWGRPFPLFVQTYLGALKCWLLMPVFGLFGSTGAVLRLANLAGGIFSLLIFMLWVRRWLGVGTALVAGSILALDPAYFFLSVLDWGSAIPSLLCRFAGFYFVLLWGQSRRRHYAFFAGLFAGLGFFNKVDFAVLIIGVGIAAFVCWRQSLRAAVRAHPLGFAWPCLGFIAGAGPMIANIPRILWLTSSNRAASTGEFAEKINATLAMYDGSYFYRLMDVGGPFDRMYQTPAPVWTPFGVLFGIACLAILLNLPRGPSTETRRDPLFLLLAAALVTIGALLLPGAVRIHHTILVYPFPHLIIAAAAVAAWRKSTTPRLVHRAGRVFVSLAVGGLLLAQVLAIQKTQQLIRETGGRGWWSGSLNAFCEEMKERSDIAIVSLDWGFNEQLMFLTGKPQLAEPFWYFEPGVIPPLPKEPDVIYLVHPPEYTLFDFGYLKAAQADPDFAVQPYRDRQGRVAFYAIQFRPQPPL